MKAGEFPDGARTLRAKIDMAAPNVWLRDPVLYRIRHAEHHHTGDKWCIYPMYDFAHCLSDYIEGITHSICTLEFEVHRPLYDWILEKLDLPRAAAASVRIRPPESELHRDEQTQAHGTREREIGEWLGRSADADDLRYPAARRDGERAAQFRLQHRHHEIPSMTDVAVLEHAMREEFNRTALAPARGAAADQGRAHQLSRRENRGT